MFQLNIEKNEKYNIDSIVAHFQAEINVNGKKSILSFDEVSRVAARFIKNSYSENPLEILEEDEKSTKVLLDETSEVSSNLYSLHHNSYNTAYTDEKYNEIMNEIMNKHLKDYDKKQLNNLAEFFAFIDEDKLASYFLKELEELI